MPNPPLPLPPAHLATRIGCVEGADPLEFYLQEGAAVAARIKGLLPPDWSFEDKRVLDFGCGPARVLRHFLDEAEWAELWGCDIDGPSIDWITANLSPPLRCFQNSLEPPLQLDDDYLDLVWATSVFTHIAGWSAWLLEMHRILAPGGVLIASFLGEGVWDSLVKEPYREDEVGMTVLRHWDAGGPGAWVFHSEWWLREHWGRAFEILDVVRPPRQSDGSPEVTQSYITMRKRAGNFTKDDLERCDPGEPREIAGLRTTERLLRDEIDSLLMMIEALKKRPEDASMNTVIGSRVRRAVLSSPLGDPARRLRRRLQR